MFEELQNTNKSLSRQINEEVIKVKAYTDEFKKQTDLLKANHVPRSMYDELQNTNQNLSKKINEEAI